VQAQIAEMTTLIGDLSSNWPVRTPPQAVHEPVEMVEVVERRGPGKRRGSGVQFSATLQPWFLLGEAHALGAGGAQPADNAVKFQSAGGTVR